MRRQHAVIGAREALGWPASRLGRGPLPLPLSPVPAFLLINGTGLVLLGAVWMQGWVDRILAADDTHICKLIFALFVVGVVWTGQQVLMLSRELNALERWPIGADARSTDGSARDGRPRRPHPGRAGGRLAAQARSSGSRRCATWPARWCCWA